MPAKYNIVPGSVADAVAGTGVSLSVVLIKSDGTRRAALPFTFPTKDHEQVHMALAALARQYDAGVATPSLPAGTFRIALSTNVDISAEAHFVP